MNVDNDKRRLGDLVRARRLELGLTIKQAAGRSGMSPFTWGQVEKGEDVRALTYAGIERSLRWYAGSCTGFLDGGEIPEVVSDSDLAREPTSAPLQMSNAQLISQLSSLAAELGRRLARMEEELHAQEPEPQQGARSPQGGRKSGRGTPIGVEAILASSDLDEASKQAIRNELDDTQPGDDTTQS